MKRTLAALVGAISAVATVPAVAGASSSATAGGAALAAEHARFSGAVVVDWNQELLSIVRTKGAQPATIHPTRSFAILHAAIYDAVVSITGGAPAYLFTVRAPKDARPDAAVAQAGHDMLTALYPAMTPALDQLLASNLATIPQSDAKRDGIRVGHEAAERMLMIRANDGSSATPPVFTPASNPGDYQLTPPLFVQPVFTNWAKVTPFVLHEADQFRPAAPPSLKSVAYATALNEVKSLGQDVSTTRTPEQTLIAQFWAAPIWNFWNEIADNAALTHGTDLLRTASLFANLNLAFADSTIAFYDAKYTYQLWRPVTAIREANTTGNPLTIADPTWTPLATTALDPSYPGAHSTISAAGALILASFFGDDNRVTVTSEVLPGVVRTFDSYHDIAIEAGLSRIFAGQHTRIDHIAGLRLGRNVAALVLDTLGASDDSAR
jgi:membrane-associated phospholipid phosphatase